jgi:hypothetical protein
VIRVELPHHLRTLAGVGAEIEVPVAGRVTVRSVLDAIEAAHPVLRGAIRDHGTLRRRPFIRFFAAGQDWSHEDVEAELPAAVGAGREPFLVIGAIAGG